MEGALINVMPGNMSSFRLRDCPDLVAMLKRLKPLRDRFLTFFTEGQYRSREGLSVDGGDARLYTLGDQLLVIAINPSDAPADVTVAVDPTVWGADILPGGIVAVDIDGQVMERSQNDTSGFRRQVRLAPDTLAMYAFERES
jgi:hypothetical protein